MGIGISGWRLARAVSLRGQLGVVSGTAIDSLFVRRLQDGDTGGHLRRAITHFPFAEAAAGALRRYFRVAGDAAGTPYRMLPMYRKGASHGREQLTMLASFVEVWLAKEGHGGLVGLNLLTKLQLPNLAALYGAMLAGVDYVLMGAGIPREIPAALDAFAAQEPATIRLEIEGAQKGMTRGSGSIRATTGETLRRGSVVPASCRSSPATRSLPCWPARPAAASTGS